MQSRTKLSASLAKLLILSALALAGMACGDSVAGSDTMNLCDTDENCPPGQYCEDGVCIASSMVCDADRPCPSGYECRNGGCAPVGGGDGGLDGEADGEVDGGDAGGDELPDAPDIEIVFPLPSDGLYLLNFGNVMVGLTVEAQVVLRNAGTRDLQILDLNFEHGTDFEDFSVPQTLRDSLPIVVTPGAETTLDVLYTASDGITDHSILGIISNDPDEALTKIHLLSEFKGEAAVAVAPTGLAFGDVPVGGSSAPLGLVVSNSGSGNAVLTVDAIRFGLVANPDWSLLVSDADQQAVSLPALLNNGDFLDVSVTYHPQAHEADAEDLVIISDDETRPNLNVPLTGQGVVGELSAEPSPLSFNQVRVGGSAQQVLSLSNSGGAALEITAAALEEVSGEWSLSSSDLDLAELANTPHALGPGESVDLTVEFAPTDVGAESGRLHLEHSGPSAQLNVALSGTGFIPAALTTDPDPAALSFTSVQYDSTAPPQTLTLPIRLGNAGGQTLSIGDMRLANGRSEFSWEPAITSIPAGADQELRVSFTPSAAGAVTERIVFETNDPDISFDGVTGRAAIELAASAIDPVIVLTPSTPQDFGNLDIGAEGRITFTIISASADPLWITAIQKGSGSSSDFRLENLPDLGSPIIGIGQSRTFDVVYQPSGLGQDHGSVEVLSSDIGNPLISVALTGTSSSCPAGTGDCDPGIAGCETDILNSMDHCGGCDRPCALDHASEDCDDGECVIVACEGSWRDCNNTDSDGCEIDISTDTDHCQACYNDCFYEHASAVCTAAGCAMSDCHEHYWDLDGLSYNGCEYNCVFSSPVDDPDPGYIDANCDGIDGEVAASVFVSTSGNDLWSGTMSNPVQSLERAYDLVAADPARHTILVSAGTYNRASTLQLADGISIYGGYEPGTWQRNASNATIIQVAASVAVRAVNITTPTTVSQLDIRGGNGASGQSAYGLIASASPGLSFLRCRIAAGRGGDGANGTSPGGVAAAGSNGLPGQKGCENSGFIGCKTCSRPTGGSGGSSACSRTGGRGGSAGHEDSDGYSGYAGSGGTAGGPGTPEHQGNWNTPSTYWGRNGNDGSAGLDGSAGAEAYASSGYAPGNAGNGVAGVHGNGGGGGGGGGGGDDYCDSYGGGGGGGGAGGCGGAGASGGSSAGGSFAVYLWNSNTHFELCELVTAGGGTGGSGGTGQPGGGGGTGGWGGDTTRPGAGNPYGTSGEQDDGSNGGRGGYGGDGGRGGHGGGGAGGPSLGVLIGGTSNPVLTDPVFTLGTGGAGGPSSGNSGAAGRRTNTYSP